MPSPKTNRNGTFPKASERSTPVTAKTAVSPATQQNLRRTRTVPELKSAGKEEIEVKKRLTKVLLNVSIQGSIGTVQVIISPEMTVKDLITATVKQYVKEGRRPVISFANIHDFDLHYSQFSLESLDVKEKIAELGSRNFFLCKSRKEVAETASSCTKEADMTTQLASPTTRLKFMRFLF